MAHAPRSAALAAAIALASAPCLPAQPAPTFGVEVLMPRLERGDLRWYSSVVTPSVRVSAGRNLTVLAEVPVAVAGTASERGSRRIANPYVGVRVAATQTSVFDFGVRPPLLKPEGEELPLFVGILLR